MTKKTQTQKLNEKNAKVNAKHKKDQANTARIHKDIREGKTTAGKALKARAGKTETEKLAEGKCRFPLRKVCTMKKATKIKTAIVEKRKGEHPTLSNREVEQQAKQFEKVVEGAMQEAGVEVASYLVEYDFKKEGKVQRRQEPFDDAAEAQAFVAAKQAKGRNPKLINVVAEPKVYKPKVIPPRPGQPRSLAEAFPLNPVANNNDGIPPAKYYDTSTELEMEEKVKGKKEAKKLRRKQRKGELLWKTPETKTITNAAWAIGSGGTPCWLMTCQDGTQFETSNLRIVFSRGHKDHHFTVWGDHHYIDGLPNKNYELILQKQQEYAQQQANRYAQSLKNFRASEPVQKEMEKRVSKKTQKAEQPYKPEELELAKLVAETANFYVITPNWFTEDSDGLAKRRKTWPWPYSREQLDALLAKAGIDPVKLSIRVMQQANRYFNKLTPRLEPGGPQIGTPELAKEHDAKLKQAAERKVVTTNDEGKTTTTTVTVHRGPKGNGERNQWGSGVGSKGNLINVAVFGGKAPNPITPAWLSKTTGVGSSRVASHLRSLLDAKLIVKVQEGGYRPANAAAAKPAREAKPASPKAAAKGKASPAGTARTKKATKAPHKGNAGTKGGKAKAGKRRK